MQVKSSQDVHGHPLDNRDGLREQPRRGVRAISSPPRKREQVLHRFAYVEKVTLFSGAPAIPSPFPSSARPLSTNCPGICQAGAQAKRRIIFGETARNGGDSHNRLVAFISLPRPRSKAL